MDRPRLPGHAARSPAVTPRPASCPALALLVVGAILTNAGAILYTVPAGRPEVYAVAALMLAAGAAWRRAARQG
ncbi:hypothetical protein [Streptomyces sp. G-G2]|uniref:hypothetical protein n=1 Tax=Streptomyces sp. G-G2 TaxID=3046201 RepID=UPI0024BA2F00|nr:hypothetical protein [Streptomyces sp. G-G2]MDJ0382127.1 hypothetical protein [Streptomyces sp. G-G2]